jgi:hypothetical protein
MKRNLLITSAAAALVAGTVFAAAQGVQTQPPGGASPGAKGQGQMPGAGKPQPPKTQGQGGQAQSQPGQEKGKAQSKPPMTQGQGGQVQPGQEKGKAQSKQPQTRGQGGQVQGQPGRESGDKSQPKQPKAQTQGQGGQTQFDTPPKQKGAQGKGAAGAGGSVNLTVEQRTKIRTTVLQGGNAPRVNKVNFSLNVGTVVPRSVRVVTVPPTLVEIHPQWRGFLYFVVGERIVIVDPNYRIVAVLVV